MNPDIYNLIYLYFTFISSYVSISLICFLIDVKKTENELLNRKIQIHNKRELLYLYKKAFINVSKNIFIWVPSFFFFIGNIYTLLIGTVGGTHYFDLYDIIKFGLNFVLIDIFFYLGHRIFHIGFLYRRYHKIHHEFKKPIAIAALYTHPVDCILANILPVLLPIIILNEGIIISNLWIITSTVNTIYISHTGEKNRSEFHDLHHEKFNYNYGTEIFMDRLFGTLRYNRTDVQ